MYNYHRGESMIIIELILVCLIVFLVILTVFYWKMKKSLSNKCKIDSKYEFMEVSELDRYYHDYYEPRIVEVISSEDIL